MPYVHPLTSARIKQIKEKSYDGLELEIYQYPSDISAYINLPFPLENDQKVLVTIESENKSFEGRGDLFEGKMKILLDDQTTQKLLQALTEQENLVIETSGFKQKIETKGFIQEFDRIKKALRIP